VYCLANYSFNTNVNLAIMSSLRNVCGNDLCIRLLETEDNFSQC
jgi:hypothetical protein